MTRRPSAPGAGWRPAGCATRRRSRRPGPRGPPFPFQAGASYLITGGLGGLGLEVVRWMVRRGPAATCGTKPPSRAARVGLPRRGEPGREGRRRRPGAGGPGASAHPACRRRGGRERESFINTYRREGWPQSGASSMRGGCPGSAPALPGRRRPETCCAPGWPGPGTWTGTWRGSPGTPPSSSPPWLRCWAPWGGQLCCRERLDDALDIPARPGPPPP